MAAEDAKRVFTESVHRLVKTWPIIKIAQQQGYGGSNSGEKIDWLSDAVAQIFFDNDVVYPDEVEDFISEFVYNEFDTIAEDHSLSKICENICRYYKLCKQGNTSVVIQEVSSMPAMEMPIIHVRDDEDNNEADPNEPTQSAGPSNSNYTHHQQDQMETDDALEEDDGWQVVRKSKNKR